MLKKCNSTKEKGVPVISILRYKLGHVFIGRSIYIQQRTGSFKEGFSKTPSSVRSIPKNELGFCIFDRVDMNYKIGFRLLTLSWSHGNTLIPVNGCLVASSKESYVLGL